LTRPKTLSQSFDIGDFIPPDILTAIDASTRAAAASILERDGLTDDIERIIDLRADTPRIPDAVLSGLVPSMNPDEFMSYDRPKPPEMTGFDDNGPVMAFNEPPAEAEDEEDAEADFESDAEAEPEPEEPFIAEYEMVDINIAIPDLAKIEHTADLVEDDIEVEMPELSRFNANLFKVKLDTLRFNREFMIRVRLVSVIVILSAAIILLITYLFTH